MGVSGQRHAPAALYPTHWIWGWVGPRAGLDAEARRKILCPCRRSNPDRPVRSRHYTAWAAAAPYYVPFEVLSLLSTICVDRRTEAWSICKWDESRFTVAEMKFILRSADWTCVNCKRNLHIMKELNTQPIMEFIKNYAANWKNHALRKTSSRIQFQILRCQPNGWISLWKP
jgi:hypothetical protein